MFNGKLVVNEPLFNFNSDPCSRTCLHCCNHFEKETLYYSSQLSFNSSRSLMYSVRTKEDMETSVAV